MSKAVSERMHAMQKLTVFVRRSPFTAGVIGLVITGSLLYGLVHGVEYVLVQTHAITQNKLLPDGPVGALPQPVTVTKSSALPPSATSLPSIVSKPKTIVTSSPSSVGGLTPTGTTTAGTSSGVVATGYTSLNWSGYFATRAQFTSVTGSWKVPSPTPTSSTESGDAAWIGIGGATTSDLIQVGTEDQVAPNGQISVAIFYELLPASAQIVRTVTVRPGDTMSASVSYSGGVWTIQAQDVTTGQTFQTTVNYTSSFSSAEWIQEDPSYASGQLVPLDNFGSVSFTGASTVRNGVSVSIAGSGAQPVTLVNNAGQALATPTAISGGSGFSVIQQ